MKKRYSKTDKDTSIVIHIMLGLVLSLISLFALSIILTVLVEKEVIDIDIIPVLAGMPHAISAFIGTILGLSLEKGRIAIVTGVVAVLYLLMLLCVNMLVYSTGISGIGPAIIGILSGGALAALLFDKIGNRKKHRIKVRSR